MFIYSQCVPQLEPLQKLSNCLKSSKQRNLNQLVYSPGVYQHLQTSVSTFTIILLYDYNNFIIFSTNLHDFDRLGRYNFAAKLHG